MASPIMQEQVKMNPQNNMMNQFNAFKQNPMQFLMRNKVNIPSTFANDPKGAVQYLMDNGQMSQQQYNMLVQKAQQMGIPLNL